MRLGQLARKLSLRPAQLVEFLAKNNIQIEESSNARLEDSHVEVIVRHYAPESLTQIKEEIDEVEEVVQIENEQQIVAPVVVESENTENQSTELPEVIRVPKIELSGLKVLGKIELPEPKKKEAISEPTEEAKESAVDIPPVEKAGKQRSSNRKPAHQNRERSQQRPWKNPLELQREREGREAEEKRRTEIEREKEKRRKHYEEKVKAVAQPKRVKPVKEQAEVKRKPVDTRPIPKTWFGKFLRWWTT
jgi:nitrate reductase NapAB chaperone NapD